MKRYKWYTLAADRQTRQEAEITVKNLDALAAKLTREQMAQAEQRARNWIAPFETR